MHALPAQAEPPARDLDEYSGTGALFFPCTTLGYDFDILVDFFGSARITTFRGADGNITMIKVHDYGTGTIYPTNDPDNRITGAGPTNVTVDFVNETFTLAGQQAHNNIPGEGRVAHVSGTITFAIDVTDAQAGEWEDVDAPPLHVGGPHDEPGWCEIFA
jgi:hypothetical protein